MSVVAFFINLGVFDPDIMEARNFVTAREMLENNQWLLPTMNGLPRLEKPPFPTWLSAFTLSAFGDSNFSMRIPAALMGCLLLFFTYKLSKFLFRSNQTAFITGVVVLTTPMIIQMGRTGSWDIFCQALMMGAVYHLYKFLKLDNKEGKKSMFYAALFTGLSAMSKGPVAIYAMLLPFLIAYFTIYGFQELKLKKSQALSYILISATLTCWWYLYARIQAPDASEYVATKEIEAWSNRHTQPFYFYLSFPAFAGIWSIFFLSACFVNHYKRKITLPKTYLFVFLWVLYAVVLLSLIPEKKERYLLPIYPPMAILIAQIIDYLSGKSKALPLVSRVERITKESFNILLLLVLFIAPLIYYVVFYKQGLVGPFQWVTLTAVVSIIFFSSYRNWRKGNLINQVMIIPIAYTLAIFFIFPALPRLKYDNPEFKDIREIQSKNWYKEFGFYTDYEINPKAIWRIGKPVKEILKGEAWPKEDFILITENILPSDLKTDHKIEIEELGTYHYFRSKSKYRLHVHKIHWKES